MKPQAGDADTHHTHRCVKALIPHLIRRVCSATTKTPPGSAAQTRAVASLGGGTIFDSQPCCFKSSAPGQFLSSFSAAAHLIPIISISHPYFPPYPYPPSSSPSPSPRPLLPLASYRREACGSPNQRHGIANPWSATVISLGADRRECIIGMFTDAGLLVGFARLISSSTQLRRR